MKATLVQQPPKPEGVPPSLMSAGDLAVVVSTSNDGWKVGDVVWRAGGTDKIWNFRTQTFYENSSSMFRVRILQLGEQVLIEV